MVRPASLSFRNIAAVCEHPESMEMLDGGLTIPSTAFSGRHDLLNPQIVFSPTSANTLDG
jgi:hypothetical protein